MNRIHEYLVNLKNWQLDADGVLKGRCIYCNTDQATIEHGIYRCDSLECRAALEGIEHAAFVKFVNTLMAEEVSAIKREAVNADKSEAEEQAERDEQAERAVYIQEVARDLSQRHSQEAIQEGIRSLHKGMRLPYPLEQVPTERDPKARGLVIPRGAVSIVAGATNHGKTALLIDMAYRMTQAKSKVLYLTNEGANWLIYDRLIKRGAGEPPSDCIAVNECHLIGDKTLADALRTILAKDPLDAVIVDWLQLVESDPPAKYERRKAEWYRLRGVMELLNSITTDYPDTAIITAAQFNRTVTHTGKMASQSIGDAIGIAQLASKVIGLWNGKYKEAIPKGESKAKGYAVSKGETNTGAIFLSVLKERHGYPLHPSTLTFEPRRARIGGESGADCVLPTADSKGKSKKGASEQELIS